MYAGFWKRFAANLIDSMILNIVIVALFFIYFIIMYAVIGTYQLSEVSSGETFSEMFIARTETTAMTVWVILMLLFLFVFPFIVYWLYYALMESSKHRATVGKMALGIVVVNNSFERLTFGRATGRCLGRVVTSFTFYIGYLMAAFTERKQALHDLIASTYVVNKEHLEYENKRAEYEGGAGTIVKLDNYEALLLGVGSRQRM